MAQKCAPISANIFAGKVSKLMRGEKSISIEYRRYILNDFLENNEAYINYFQLPIHGEDYVKRIFYISLSYLILLGWTTTDFSQFLKTEFEEEEEDISRDGTVNLRKLQKFILQTIHSDDTILDSIESFILECYGHEHPTHATEQVFL